MFVKFQKAGFQGDRLNGLESDGLRWRWWRLNCLSNTEIFPGLVMNGNSLTPLPEMSIIGEVYKSREFDGKDKLAIWRNEKQSFLASGLVKSTVVDGSGEFLWNVDYHHYQDKASKKGAQLRARFYTGYLKLENEKDRAMFVVLLSRFKPKDVDPSVFFIPELVLKFEAHVMKSFPLFGGKPQGNGSVKPLLGKVTERVREKICEEDTEGKSDTKDFVQWYCTLYQEVKRQPYMRGGKDYKLASEMLKVFSMQELKALSTKFLKEDDPFTKKAGYTIGVFKAMINRLVGLKEKKPRGLDDYSKYR